MNTCWRFLNLLASFLLFLSHLLDVLWSHQKVHFTFLGSFAWVVSAVCVFRGWSWAWWLSSVCGTVAFAVVMMLAPAIFFTGLGGDLRDWLFIALALVLPFSWILHFASRPGRPTQLGRTNGRRRAGRSLRIGGY